MLVPLVSVLMPRIAGWVAKPAALICTPGVIRLMSVALVTPALRSSCCEIALIDIGTFSSCSLRRSAVTTTSCSTFWLAVCAAAPWATATAASVEPQNSAALTPMRECFIFPPNVARFPRTLPNCAIRPQLFQT